MWGLVLSFQEDGIVENLIGMGLGKKELCGSRERDCRVRSNKEKGNKWWSS